jgi:hypothetical protein
MISLLSEPHRQITITETGFLFREITEFNRMIPVNTRRGIGCLCAIPWMVLADAEKHQTR